MASTCPKEQSVVNVNNAHKAVYQLYGYLFNFRAL